MVEILRDLNQFDEAEEFVEQALSKPFNPVPFLGLRADVAFAKGDAAKFQQMVAATRGKPVEGRGLFWQARAAAFSGKWRSANDLFSQAIEVSRRNGQVRSAASYACERANGAAYFGQCEQARQHVADALPLLRDANAVILASHPLARCGDTRRAQDLAAEYGRVNDPRSVEFKTGLPASKAVVALFTSRPDVTVELLPLSTGLYGLGDLQNWYVGGEAYLALRQGGDAAREFQSILDHRGVDPLDFRWPLAHLGLARAAALTGDTAKPRPPSRRCGWFTVLPLRWRTRGVTPVARAFRP